MQQALQNDGMYEYVTQGKYNKLYGPATAVNTRLIQERVMSQRRQNSTAEGVQSSTSGQSAQEGVRQQQSGGIRIEVDSPTRTARSRNNRTASIQNAQRRAQQEQRRLARERAAEATARRSAERRRQEEDRRRKEEERRRQEYERVYNQEAERSAIIHERHARNVEFKSNEGRDFMYDYRPNGFGEQRSEYIAETQISQTAVVPKVDYGRNDFISLSGDETVMPQTANWERSADLNWLQVESVCEDEIVVESLTNGCGPANATAFVQFATDLGKYLDAVLYRSINPVGDLVQTIQTGSTTAERLDHNACAPHDVGYYQAKNKWEKSMEDLKLISRGGTIMGVFTLFLGGDAWESSQEQKKESNQLAADNPEIIFNPQTHYLKRSRNCHLVQKGEKND